MKISKLVALFMLVVASASAQKKPNIVYIICDDLGYGDVQVLNPEKGKILTPKIDAFAKESMTFTDAHSASAVCTPSRYAILTGRYSWRSRLQQGVLGTGDELEPLIAENITTVPKMLKSVGYKTAAIGKWHLGFKFVDDEGKPVEVYDGKKVIGPAIGSTVPNGPVSRGFDSYIGFHHSRVMKTVIKNDKVVDKMEPVKMLQFLADQAEDYIVKESKNNTPFFMYLALNSPHSPVVPSKAWQGKSGMGDYADFVMETDDVVGRVLEALKANGIEDNTLVFFTSDNGCSYPVAKVGKLENEFGHYPSADFRGYKSDIWEGGHRIPFMVRWPEHIEANSINDKLICQTSLMATCAEITGLNMDDNTGVDSYSILPMLKNKKAKTDYNLVVHHSIHGKFSIRNKKWKLELTPGSGGWSNPTDNKARKENLPEIQLYNMKTDAEETTNVYKKHPRVVAKLTKKLKHIVENGRTTSGKPQENDVPVDLYKTETTQNTAAH
ncbi:sulfatase family protein [Algibacter lectus]|uniref:Arylsulfatase A-like enzyme n=2 Tax=Algibacter lectus TaxID=221126 RepID=A0A090X045_9FLAO|nr:arylsulfatase [Algibacter lectus]MWW25716.1 sulfatase-like hydrolase/transferase [Algibacter lectus]TDY60996.1 arylsulfatase A-like enzyme [Algibacter lectus]GAL81898.1 choline-sulfatase [Algibacter lectus]SFD53323.1 Arylsulfatase A [Algibacter lectus]